MKRGGGVEDYAHHNDLYVRERERSEKIASLSPSLPLPTGNEKDLCARVSKYVICHVYWKGYGVAEIFA